MKKSTITLQFLGKPRKLRVVFSQYGNGSKAVILNETNGEQFCVVSVNMPNESDFLPPDTFFVKDWSENEPVVAELKRLGFLVSAPSIRPASSGFVTAYAYRWIDDPQAEAAKAAAPAVRVYEPPAFDERDCGGSFDGHTVTSDADPGL